MRSPFSNLTVDVDVGVYLTAMILTLEITPLTIRRGTVAESRSTPSTRKRTTRRFSNGSTWMSEAFSLTACVSTALISRMIGASSSLSSRSTNVSMAFKAASPIATLKSISWL